MYGPTSKTAYGQTSGKGSKKYKVKPHDRYFRSASCDYGCTCMRA